MKKGIRMNLSKENISISSLNESTSNLINPKSKTSFFNRYFGNFFCCNRKLDSDDDFIFYIPRTGEEVICRVTQINTR